MWGDLLLDHILINAPDYDVRRKDGSLALQVNPLEAERLAAQGMAAGYVSGGVLRYLILRVPKSTVVRVLRMDPPKPGEITRGSNGDSLKYSRYCDVRHAKLGRVGAPARAICWTQR